MKVHGHSKTEDLTHSLNSIIRGWLNYFEISGVCFPIKSKYRPRYYLSVKLYRYYARKSQRKCKLFGQKVFDVLTTKYKLIDPIKYALT